MNGNRKSLYGPWCVTELVHCGHDVEYYKEVRPQRGVSQRERKEGMLKENDGCMMERVSLL